MDHQYIQSNNYILDCGWLLDIVRLGHKFRGTGLHIFDWHTPCFEHIQSLPYILGDKPGVYQYSLSDMNKPHGCLLACIGCTDHKVKVCKGF